MANCHTMHRLVLTVLVLLLATSAVGKRPRQLSKGLSNDKAGLLALKNSISSSGRSKAGAWKPRGNPCFPKPWPHVTCGSGRVTAIDLSNLDVVGTLPTQLKKLNKLEILNFENNGFTGSVPDTWADRRRFRKLDTINLGNNNLNGALPNRKWNLRGAFRKLSTLILSNNLFAGGLPDGWLSTGNTFRKLKFLDLSNNQLGNDASGTALDPYAPDADTPTTGWCLQGRTADSGWCPDSVSKARAFSLEVLDLSENALKGQLPTQWAQLFPNLLSLLLQRNSLWAGTKDVPAVLPDSWTRRTVPRAFPQLETLVLYPGNDNICSVPDPTGGFLNINTVSSYTVEDDSEMAFDAETPYFCTGPATDNPATSPSVSSATNIEVSWAAPAGALAATVYGYRVTLSRQDPDTEEWGVVPPFVGALLPVYNVDLSSGPLSVSGGTYTLDTQRAVPTLGSALAGQYKAEITTVNLNLEESTPATSPATQLPPPPPPPPPPAPLSVTLAKRSGVNRIDVSWQPPASDADVDGYKFEFYIQYNGAGDFVHMPSSNQNWAKADLSLVSGSYTKQLTTDTNTNHHFKAKIKSYAGARESDWVESNIFEGDL